jgi:hypothetical protein
MSDTFNRDEFPEEVLVTEKIDEALEIERIGKNIKAKRATIAPMPAMR